MLKLLSCRALLAVSLMVPFQLSAQTPDLESLRRDFEELTLHKPGQGLTELTSTYLVYGGRWNGKDVGAYRIEFAKIDRVTTQSSLIYEPGKKDFVHLIGDFHWIGWEECIVGKGCSGAKVAYAWNPSFTIKPTASLERVNQFVERLKRLARANGATISELKQYVPSASDPCPDFGRRVNLMMERIASMQEEPNNDSDNLYLWEGDLQKNACIDITRDSEAEIRRKVQYFYAQFADLIDSGRGDDFLVHGVRSRNEDFVKDFVKAWQLPVNGVRRQQTALDFIVQERGMLLIAHDTTESTRRDTKSLDRMYNFLRRNGALHARELGIQVRTPSILGTWRGEICNRIEFSTTCRWKMPVELTITPGNVGFRGSATLPQLGVHNIQLVNFGNYRGEWYAELSNVHPKQRFASKVLPDGNHLMATYSRDTTITLPFGTKVVNLTFSVDAVRTSGEPFVANTSLDSWVGTWVSDQNGTAQPRTLVLSRSGAGLAGTVTYRSGSGAVVEETVSVAPTGPRKMRLVGTGYRVIEGSVSGFNLDYWDLEMAQDGVLLVGEESDDRSPRPATRVFRKR